MSEYQKEWYRKNLQREREKRRISSAKRKIKDPETYRKKHREWVRKARKDRPEEFREKARIRYRKRRDQILSHYGGKCIWCGIDNYDVLVIDHINGGGTRQVAALGGQTCFQAWIIKNNFPDGLQILCHNCNHLKRLKNNESVRKFDKTLSQEVVVRK